MTSAVPPGFPSPSPGREAIEPPAALGEIFSRTFSAVKRRFWTLLGINLVSAVASTLSMVVMSGMTIFQLQSLERESLDQQEKWTFLILTSFVVVPLVLFVLQIVSAKAGFVGVAGADRLLAGERPTFSEMWRGSSGSLRRSIPLWIIFTIFVALFNLANVVLVFQEIQSGASLMHGLIRVYSFIFVVFFILMYFAVRWVYVGQLLALEKASAVESLRRSWGMTSRDFWRTLGYLFVGYLIALMVYTPATMLGAGTMLASSDQLIAAIEPFRSDEVMGLLIAILVSVFTVIAPQAILTVLVSACISTCFLVYVAAMYRDQRYRDFLSERGIDPKNVTPVWQGPSQHHYPAEQPSLPPHPSSGHAPGAS